MTQPAAEFDKYAELVKELTNDADVMQNDSYEIDDWYGSRHELGEFLRRTAAGITELQARVRELEDMLKTHLAVRNALRRDSGENHPTLAT